MFTGFLFIIFVALSAAELAVPKKCHVGSVYCGRNLLKTGDYINKIITSLRANNESAEDYNIQNSLWACIHRGDIALIEVCPSGCVSDSGQEGYCEEKGNADKKNEVTSRVDGSA